MVTVEVLPCLPNAVEHDMHRHTYTHIDVFTAANVLGSHEHVQTVY
jgi:hypothetical protein